MPQSSRNQPYPKTCFKPHSQFTCKCNQVPKPKPKYFRVLPSLAATPLSAEQNALHEAARFCDMPRAAHKKSKLQPIQKEQLNYYSFISCKAGHYLHFNFQQVLGLQGISFHRFLDFKHTPHLESCSHSFNLFIGFLGLLGQGGHPCFSTLQIPFCVIRQLLAQLEEIHHVFWFETC